MRLNDKYFSFPPYISISWSYVAALHLEVDMLLVFLTSGQMITIPNLKPEIIEEIFTAHQSFLEKEGVNSLTHELGKSPLHSQNLLLNQEKLTEFPMKFGINPLDGLGTSLQHNPALANAPDLPRELIQKIASITKIVAGEESQNFPKGEPHCNCFYCQISRGIHTHEKEESLELIEQSEHREEDFVSEEELQFQQWNIQQAGDQLFKVTNRLDTLEQYNVYLGHPVGCTCGKSGCEHIIAVLRA